jgi:hypothetical protein
VTTATRMARGIYAVRLYEPGMADACERFVRRVWPKDGDAVRASGDASQPPRVLFLKEQEVIGHVATMPVRLAVGGRQLDAAWAVGLVVLPEYRNGPVAPLLVKKLNEAVDIALTLHVEEAALRVFKGVGWHHLGVIPQYVRVLNARAFVRTFARRGRQFLPDRGAKLWAVLPHVSAPVAGFVRLAFTGLAAAGVVSRRRAAGVSVVEERAFDPGYTELAERVKHKLGVWVIRDEEYLATRYGRRMAAYRLLACRRQGRLLGYAVVKLKEFVNDPRMGDTRMGTLVDSVFDPDEPEILDALLAGVVRLSRRERVDVVFCTASLRMLGRHLKRHAFVTMPGTLNAAMHDRTGVLGAPRPLDQWHLMRGDSDADANC